MGPITLNIGSSIDPKEVLVAPTQILRDILKENGVNPNAGVITVDGRRLGDAELDKTISELGLVDGQFVTLTEKMMSAK